MSGVALSSAVTLYASIGYQDVTPIIGVHYRLTASYGNLITLTLLPTYDKDNRTIYTQYFLVNTQKIPDISYIDSSNQLTPVPSPAYYCLIGAGKDQQGGGVVYSSPGDTALPFIVDMNNYTIITFQGDFVSINNTYNGLQDSTITVSNTSPTLWPFTAATALDSAKNTVNFNYGTNLYYGGMGSTAAAIIQWWWPPPITSNICFPAGTPVKTDQGLFPIEKLRPGINTINRNRIDHITRTITTDNYLVCFEKDSLDLNYPIRKTLISKNHKILYKNKMIEAYKFINSFHGVYKVEYNGDILYNVLMDNYSTMDVNNLICETLHPQNAVALLHNSSYSAGDKSKIISMLSESLKNKDSTSYKKIRMPITYKK
jgi:hypothetical protein